MITTAVDLAVAKANDFGLLFLFMANIPKPIIIFVVFFVAIAGILLVNPPYTKCQSQIEILRKNMEGDIFSRQGKRLMFSPRLNRYVEICKSGNGPGGCFELFQLLRKVNRELRNFPAECSEELTEVGEVLRAIREPMVLMVQLAWGEQPPAGPEARNRWFEPADLALFCEMRDNYMRIYGNEEYEKFRMAVSGSLPGEPPMFSEGQCVNCEFRKKASQILKSEDVWKRSLFSTPCQAYR